MPYRRRRYRARPRRRFKSMRFAKRRYRRKRPRMSISNTMNTPLGMKKRVVMRWYERSFSLNPGVAGTIAALVFNATSPYDPYTSGGGHQANGFDQLVGVLYDHYTVIKSSCQVTFNNTDTTNPQTVFVMLKDNDTLENDPQKVMENGAIKYTQVSAANDGNSTKQIVYNVTPHKFLGISKPLSNDSLKGSSTSNPSENVYYHVGAFPWNATDSAAVEITIKIQYVCILTEPKKLGTS